jgi:hypothetical protein
MLPAGVAVQRGVTASARRRIVIRDGDALAALAASEPAA